MSVSNQASIQASLAALEKDPALSQKDFSNIARAFAFHPDQGRFLLEINAHNKKMAETLLVFRKRLADAIAQGEDLAALMDLVFLHYIINTDGPILESEGSDPFDVFDAATRYAEALLVGLTKDANGGSILHIDDKEFPCPEWGAVPGCSAAYGKRIHGMADRAAKPNAVSSGKAPARSVGRSPGRSPNTCC